MTERYSTATDGEKTLIIRSQLRGSIRQQTKQAGDEARANSTDLDEIRQ